jgi:hypothetical protein
MAEFLQRNLHTDDLVIISISPLEMKSLLWCDRNEFRYHGEMYDVIDRKTGSDGRIYFYCFNDHKEKKLLTELNRHVKTQTENSSGSKQDKTNPVQNVLKEYYSPTQSFAFAISGEGITYPDFTIQYIPFDPEQQSPPPKQA